MNVTERDALKLGDTVFYVEWSRGGDDPEIVEAKVQSGFDPSRNWVPVPYRGFGIWYENAYLTRIDALREIEAGKQNTIARCIQSLYDERIFLRNIRQKIRRELEK